MSNMTNKRPSVAIVGAGMAGLSCARHLQDAGYLVELFDKGVVPGGRMSTRRSVGWQCDHGAQYFTVRDAGFMAEVMRWEQAGVAAPWLPRLCVLDGGAARQVERGGKVRFVGAPRMNAPAAWLASGLRLRSRVTVRQILHADGGWRLRSEEHGEHAEHYDALMLAVPAPQAAALLEPLLPLTAQLAASTAMLPCWTLMLRLRRPHDPGYDAAFVHAGPLRWIARDSSKPGRQGDEVWVLQAGAEWSAAHVEHDEAEVTRLLLAEYARLGGPVSEVEAATAHRWRYAKPASRSLQRALWLPAVQVGLCGDWLSGGRLEDAWLSGRALAENMLASLPVAA